MRLGQSSNKRMRGRNRSNKGPNPLTRSYESNGPDVKVRGTAQHIAEKYAQLARDAHASGDPVMAESYLQHAEHYYRIIITAQAQFASQPGGFTRGDEPEGEEMEDAEDMPFAEIQMKLQQQDRQQQERQFEQREQREQRDQRPPRQDQRHEPRQERSFDRNNHQPRPQQDRPEFGEQPSVDFPMRGLQPADGERQERPERQERGERPHRQPRHERTPRFAAPRPVNEDDAPAAAEQSAAPADNDMPQEAGLPSFLTRGRRRARPPFRRGGEGEDNAPADTGNDSADQPAS